MVESKQAEPQEQELRANDNEWKKLASGLSDLAKLFLAGVGARALAQTARFLTEGTFLKALTSFTNELTTTSKTLSGIQKMLKLKGADAKGFLKGIMQGAKNNNTLRTFSKCMGIVGVTITLVEMYFMLIEM